jgi:hypothetical protein
MKKVLIGLMIFINILAAKEVVIFDIQQIAKSEVASSMLFIREYENTKFTKHCHEECSDPHAGHTYVSLVIKEDHNQTTNIHTRSCKCIWHKREDDNTTENNITTEKKLSN